MELNNEFRVGVPVAQAWNVLTDVERIAPCMPGAQLQEIEGDEYRGIVKVKVGPITAQYKGKATFLERDEAAGRLVLRAEGRETRGQGNAAANITALLMADGDATKVTVNTDLTVTGKVAQFGRGVMADVSAKILGQFVECLETTVLADANVASASGRSVDQMTAGDSRPSEPVVTGQAPEPVEAALAEAAPLADPLVSTVSAAPGSTAGAAPGTTASAAPGSNGSGAADAPAGPTVRKISHAAAKPVDLLDAAGAPVAKRLIPVGIVALILLILLRRRSHRG
jgi:carbon monoxide dehydrogenase subunit G